jgi:hypothetical protein
MLKDVVHIVTCICVTVEGVSIGEWICWTVINRTRKDKFVQTPSIVTPSRDKMLMSPAGLGPDNDGIGVGQQ